jgi:hypothetical protein
MSRALSGLCFAILVTVASAPAHADPPVDDATRTSARQLGAEGKELFDKGDYKGALDKYERADALVHVPTLGVRAARCLERMGRLVEASERYLQVTRVALPPDALPVLLEAVQQAVSERAALLPRIPALIIRPTGPMQDTLVRVDDAEVPPALYGQKRAVNPGQHRVVAVRAGATVAQQDVTIREADALEVALTIPVTAPPVEPPPRPNHHESKGSSTQKVAGAVLLGVGGAGVVLGAIGGILALTQRSEVETTCGPNLDCDESHASLANGYNSKRTIATIGIWGGLGLAAAGTVLILTAPSKRASVSGYLSVGAAGVRGSF